MRGARRSRAPALRRPPPPPPPPPPRGGAKGRPAPVPPPPPAPPPQGGGAEGVRSPFSTVALLRRRGETVAGAADGVEDRPLEPFLELAPEPADMDVDDVGAGIEMIVPDLLEQHRPSDDAAFVAGEIFEQPIFARLEVDHLAGALDHARQRLHL